MAGFFLKIYWRIAFWVDGLLTRAKVQEQDRWQRQLAEWEKTHRS